MITVVVVARMILIDTLGIRCLSRTNTYQRNMAVCVCLAGAAVVVHVRNEFIGVLSSLFALKLQIANCEIVVAT